MKPRDYIDLSKRMLTVSNGKPSQVVLRRATSTAYYALFHTLAACGANLLIGGTKSTRSNEAWRQVYRALEHGFAKNTCRNGEIISKFPKGIEDFANMFVAMQEKRHKADYDPTVSFSKSAVRQDINAAEEAMHAFEVEHRRDRCAFAAYVLFKNRN